MPKGKRMRSVPMAPDVIDALAHLKERDEYIDADGLVFANPVGQNLDSWALRRRHRFDSGRRLSWSWATRGDQCASRCRSPFCPG
jgi:hypothetical protein